MMMAEVIEWHMLLPGAKPFDFERITQCVFCRRLTDSLLTPGGRNSTFRVCRPCTKEMGGGLEMVRQRDVPLAWHRVRLTEGRL